MTENWTTMAGCNNSQTTNHISWDMWDHQNIILHNSSTHPWKMMKIRNVDILIEEEYKPGYENLVTKDYEWIKQPIQQKHYHLRQNCNGLSLCGWQGSNLIVTQLLNINPFDQNALLLQNGC
jgi:hypothetical protein